MKIKQLRTKIILGFTLFYSIGILGSVTNYSRNNSVTLLTESPNFSLTTSSNVVKKEELTHKPNSEAVDGIQLAVGENFSVSASSKRTPNAKSLTIYGDTKYEDYRFQFMRNSFFLKSYYQSYRGFYIDNPNKINPNLTNDEPRLLIPKLNGQIVGLNLFYVFEPQEYSLPAALYQSAKQSSSGGSLIMGLSVVDFNFTSVDYLIPVSQQAYYGSDANILKGHFSAFNATLGYGYTLVFAEKWFLSGILLYGSGQELAEYYVDTTIIKRTAKSIQSQNIIAFGFNGDMLYGGLAISNENTSHYTNSLTLRTALGVFNLHFGLRF